MNEDRIEKAVVAAPYSCTISEKMGADQEAQQVGTWRTQLSYCITWMFSANHIYTALFQSVTQHS